MKRKKTKKKTGFGLSSKSNLLAKKNCPLSKKNENEINNKNIKFLKKKISN